MSALSIISSIPGLFCLARGTVWILKHGGPFSSTARRLYERNWGVALLTLAIGIWLLAVYELQRVLPPGKSLPVAAGDMYLLVVFYLQPLLFATACQLIALIRLSARLLVWLLLKLCALGSAIWRSITYVLEATIHAPFQELFPPRSGEPDGFWFSLFFLSFTPLLLSLAMFSFYSHYLLLPSLLYVVTPGLIVTMRRPCIQRATEYKL